MANLIPVVYGISLGIGILLIVASSIFLNELRPELDACDYMDLSIIDTLCEPVKANVGSTCLGIGAGVIQLIFCGFLLTKKNITRNTGIGTHVTGLILSLIGFGVSMYYDDTYFMDILKEFKSGNRSKIIFFYVVIGIDWVFCVVAIVILKWGQKQNVPPPQPTNIYVQQPIVYPMVTIPNNQPRGPYQTHQQFYGMPSQQQQYYGVNNNNGPPQIFTLNQQPNQHPYPVQSYQQTTRS